MPLSRILAFLTLAATLSPQAPAGEVAPCFDAIKTPGEKGPPTEFVAPTLDGTPWRLSEHRGQVVLASFWAGWCPPCIAEMPALKRLAQRFQGRPFLLVAIDAGEPEARVRNLARQLGIGFTVLTDPDNAIFSGWGGKVLPTAFLIDARGQRRLIAQGPVDWDDPKVVGTIEGLIGEVPYSSP